MAADKETKAELADGVRVSRGHFLKRMVSESLEAIIGPQRERRPIDHNTGRRTSRTREEVRRDLLAISEMYLRGWSQYEIAEYLGITRQLVCHELTKIQKIWQEHIAANHDRLRANELAKLDHLEARAWEQFDKSCEDAETYAEEEFEAGFIHDDDSEQTPTGGKKRKLKKRQGQSGDPRYMQIIRECAAERCKILGLYAPKQHQVQMQAEVVNYSLLSYDERKVLERALARQIEARAEAGEAAAGLLTDQQRGSATGQLPGFAALIAGQGNLPDDRKSISVDCVPVAASADNQPGGGELVQGDVLEAEWEEVPGDEP